MRDKQMNLIGSDPKRRVQAVTSKQQHSADDDGWRGRAHEWKALLTWC